MTEQDIKDMIKINLPVMEGMPAENRAQLAYTSAINHVALMDSTPWNKVATTITLTSGTSSYAVGQDLLTDYKSILSISRLRYNTKNKAIKIIDLDKFNELARGGTETGEPSVAVYHGRDKTLEFYPIPDDNYVLWVQVRVPLDIESINPDEFRSILIWQGVMNVVPADNPVYANAVKMRDEIVTSLIAADLNKIDATQIYPDYMIGRTGQRGSGHNSGDYYDL